MNKLPPVLKTDFYKQGHREQYPKGTELVCSNLTARGSYLLGITKVIHFGTQASIQMMHEDFKYNFFSQPKRKIVNKFKRRLDNALGIDTPTKHIEALHDLGYLPLTFWGIPEGNKVNLRVPMVQFWNTIPEFFWLTNFIETEFSCNTWPFITSATTADLFRKTLESNAKKTDPQNLGFTQFQGHDFSYRGMFGSQAAWMSGLAHLTSFAGTDTIPAIDAAEHYYDANSDKELIGTSVWATEHSVMCMGGAEDEEATFKRLLTETYPTGIVSVVSDTWNLWEVVGGENSIVGRLKDLILARDGKLVIRPDSGDPVKIICGYNQNDRKQMTRNQWNKLSEFEKKGVVECLWDIFGGDMSETEFKRLNEKIGAIYGDSITLQRAEQITSELAKKGFASTNVVLGIGSFTYQGAIQDGCIVTRDTHGMAIKATYGQINGEARAIFKDPITDSGLKKSAKGLIAVYKGKDGYEAHDEATFDQVRKCEFKEIYTNGKWENRENFETIRQRIKNQ